MPLHPELPERRQLSSRRTPSGGSPPPQRNPRRHGRALSDELSEVQRQRRIDSGIDPDLVFKIRTARSLVDTATLERRGVFILGETVDWTYFVLAHDEGSALGDAILAYRQGGADEEGAKGPLSSLFDKIDAIEPYSPEDRTGPGLDEIEWIAERAVVDVSLWPADDYREAERRAGIVMGVLNLRNGEVLHRAIGTRRNVLRVSVTEEGLLDVLNTSVVERARTPPVPFIDRSDWWDVSVGDLTLTPEGGVPVGVIDDAPATGHPLLDGLVASVTEVGPAGYHWPAPGFHGTAVVGRVLFPRLEAELRSHSPITARGTVHVARVLEPRPERSKRVPLRRVGGASRPKGKKATSR